MSPRQQDGNRNWCSTRAAAAAIGGLSPLFLLHGVLSQNSRGTGTRPAVLTVTWEPKPLLASSRDGSGTDCSGLCEVIH